MVDDPGPVVGLGVGCVVPVPPELLCGATLVNALHVESAEMQAVELATSTSTSKVSEVPLASVTVYVIVVTETPAPCLVARKQSKSTKLTQDTLQSGAEKSMAL